MAIVIGKAAPPFVLMDADGNSVALADEHGKNVIVYFYPKDDTPGCTKEAQGFRDLWKKIQRQEATVIGISPDGPAAHQKFIKKYTLPFVLLSDPDRKVMKRYGAFGEKVKDGQKTLGVIRSSVLIGKDGTVLCHWPRVEKAEAHPVEALAVAKKLVG